MGWRSRLAAGWCAPTRAACSQSSLRFHRRSASQPVPVRSIHRPKVALLHAFVCIPLRFLRDAYGDTTGASIACLLTKKLSRLRRCDRCCVKRITLPALPALPSSFWWRYCRNCCRNVAVFCQNVAGGWERAAETAPVGRQEGQCLARNCADWGAARVWRLAWRDVAGIVAGDLAGIVADFLPERCRNAARAAVSAFPVRLSGLVVWLCAASRFQLSCVLHERLVAGIVAGDLAGARRAVLPEALPERYRFLPEILGVSV